MCSSPTRYAVALCAASLSCVSCAAGGSFWFVRDGKPVATLVATGDKKVDADIAFFTNAVRCCTGASLPVVGSCASGAGVIRFETEKRPIYEEDRYEVEFPASGGMLVRGTAESCRWALNRILEERFGCVFCFPGDNGTHHPRSETVSMERRPFSGNASMLAERHMYVEDPDWERALCGRQLSTPGQFYGHMLWRVLPPKKYRGTPLWDRIMPLKNGVRRNVKDEEHHTWQPCLATEESVAEAVKNICEYLDERPHIRVHSLSVNDMEGYCECDACRKLNGGFGRKSRFGRYESHSESYYAWANRVAEGVVKKHPHVLFGLLAYCGTIDPPSFRLHPNIIPFLCTAAHQMMDDAVAAERTELFREWSAKADHIGNWGYDYGALNYVVPRLYLSAQRKFFDLKKAHPGFDAYFGEGQSFIGEGPKRYMFYRRMFKGLRCDDDAELDRWYDACCGKAASDHLRAYYGEWEKFWTGEAIRKTGWYGGVRGVYFIFHNHSYMWGFDEAILERASAHLEKAIAAAKAHGDPAQTARAERIALFHRFYAAKMRVFGLGFRPFSDNDTAVRFFRALPSIADAAKEMSEAGKVICSELGYPKGYKPYPGRERHLRIFSERANTPINQNLLQLLNCAVRVAATSCKAREAASVASNDPRVMLEIRERLATLVKVSELPNLADGIAPEKSLKKWTWDFPQIDENRQFYCTFKLTNKRVGAQSYWMHFAGWNPKYRLWRGHDEVMLRLAPGESKVVSFFCKAISGVRKGRLSICAYKSDFGTVDDIEVEDLKLCEVKSSVKQVWPD